MSLKLFITGTDTNIGKTYISVALLHFFNQNNFSTVAIKPLASGCFRQANHLYSADALALKNAASISLSDAVINPIAFEPPIAPHLAAERIRYSLSVAKLLQQSQAALQYPADVCIVEGVGGWYVPLNAYETMADFVKAAHLRVLLVVGIRLGCLNHAILTYQAIQKDGVELVGWLANCVDPDMLAQDENITALQQWLPITYLGKLHYGQDTLPPHCLTMLTSPTANACNPVGNCNNK